MKPNRARLLTETCVNCGVVFQRPSGRRMWRCRLCRRELNAANMDAQHAKTGPLYEKSVRSNLIHWTAEAKRLGITIE